MALLIAGFAGAAAAQITSVTDDVDTPTTWCDNEDTIVLTNPIFVTSKLTILPGCIIRGDARTAAFDEQNPSEVGAPGALIIAQDGFLDAQGGPANPIIMTGAAMDANNDGVADDLNPADGFIDAWDGASAFLDDTPATNPLAPLDDAGNHTVGLWGGLVLLGRAPTNLGLVDAALGYGKAIVEGLIGNNGVYGGYEPHDSSGILRYVSVRHAGDEIGEGNELNGITLGGVGDGTIIENVEVYANQDDGVEMFGGTVNIRNVVTTMIGDDSIDIDQGYSGMVQFGIVAMPFFNQNSGATFGAASGDNGGEWDGDDCTDPDSSFSCNYQIDNNNVPGLGPLGGGDDNAAIPNAHPVLYNITMVGPNDEDTNNPATSPAQASRGWRARDGWTGALVNSIVNNFANTNQGLACEISSDIGVYDGQDVVRWVTTTVADSDGLDAECVQAATDGDTAVANGEYDGQGTTNLTAVAGEILVNDNYFFDPQGVAVNAGVNDRRKLQGSKVGAIADFRPANASAAAVSGGVTPRGEGLDASATYRGALPASQDPWTDGWTVLSLGNIW